MAIPTIEVQQMTIRQLRAENERLRVAAQQMLDTFYEKGFPGHPCLRSAWVDIEQIEAWRAVLRQGVEGQVTDQGASARKESE